MPGSSPGMTSAGWRTASHRFKISNSRHTCQQTHLPADTPASRHTYAFPRRVFARVVRHLPPQRAWGMPGAQCTRSLACKIKGTRKRSHHGYTGTTRHSRTRMVLTVSFVLFPEIGLVCLRRPAGFLPQDLTPASRRQNHTTSPSASGTFVHAPLASTASRPALMTLRNAPWWGGTGRNIG